MKFVVIPLLAALVAALVCSCRDELTVRQAYEFSLATMPVPKRIAKGETVEIRCRLDKTGRYAEAKFFLRYFQSDGAGELRLDDGTVLAPNDEYPLEREVFRLYYTSACSETQTLDLVVCDNFGQRCDLTLSFQNAT